MLVLCYIRHLLRKKDFEVEIKLRQVNEYFIPYIDVPIIPDALSECDCTLINDIKISPTVNDIQAKNSLQLLLQKYPCDNTFCTALLVFRSIIANCPNLSDISTLQCFLTAFIKSLSIS